MLFVLVAQGILWAWVFAERNRKIPDVKIMNWRELLEMSQKGIEEAYRRARSSLSRR